MYYYLVVNNKTVYIDEKDSINLVQHKWRVRKDGRIQALINGKLILMHRLIMKAKKDQKVDHIDGNPLNNTRVNLRFCTNSQNQMNSKKRSGCKTDFKGVTYRRGGFELYVNGKFIRKFDSSRDAAIGYDIISKQLYGEFSRPNFPMGFSNEEFNRISNLLTFKKEGSKFFTSKYKGIGFHKTTQKWRARVNINNKWKTLGYHKTEIEALKQLTEHYEHNSK